MDNKFVQFISRPHPDVGQEEVRIFLEGAGISEVEYQKLTTRNNTYNYFKVALLGNLSDKVLKTEFWPPGTLVKEFT